MVQPAGWARLYLRIALVVYFLFAAALIRQKPGLHYDEAILLHGSVQMSRSAQELPISHPEHSWIQVFGRSLPLMSLAYAGAVKEYLCLPAVALFGPRTMLFRAIAALLGALGLWGFARLVQEQAGARAGGAVALALAVNPTYVAMNVFDNGTTSAWIAVLGLLALAVARYLRKPTTAAACLAGALAGLGIWTRANFLWILAACAVAAVVVLRRKLLLPARHYAAAALGALAGGFPFLLFQAISGFGTWQSMSAFHTGGAFTQRLYTRIVLFAEMLITDRAHRSMWDAMMEPAKMYPSWQRWLFPLVVLASWAVCATARARMHFAHIVSLAFLILAAILAFSTLTIAEHHLIALLPFAVTLVALACGIVAARSRVWRGVVGALASVYLACAINWQAAAIGGLHTTGGLGHWSDALIPLGQQLEQKYFDRPVKLLDWGLGDNLFVVTGGRLRLFEMFWGATTEKSGMERPWAEEVQIGGVFVLNGGRHRALPDATTGFLAALDALHPVFRRTGLPQRDGTIYAEVFDIVPNSTRIEISSSIAMGDPQFGYQLRGFYAIEQNQFRWTQRKFSIDLRAPEGTRAFFTMDLYIPDIVIQKLGPITLAASVNDRPLEAQVYREAGVYKFRREIEAGLKPGTNRFDFALDKALPPSTEDDRELGISVTKASLDVH